jgi:hypothetical protein
VLARPFAALALVFAAACAHPYRSLERDDWAQVREGPAFETARAGCEAHRDAQPFRYGSDPRRIFAGCMRRHGWEPRR